MGLVASGEGPVEFQGKGTLWLQSRNTSALSGGSPDSCREPRVSKEIK